MKKLLVLTVLTLLYHFASFGQCSISGSMSICIGGSTTISVDTTVSGCAHGAWSSSNTSIAIVDTTGSLIDSSGDSIKVYIAYGISAGVVTISYSSGSGISTATLTVNPLPASITGTSIICAGSTTTLADATPGGSWTSSSTYIATVNPATGVVTGISAGTVEIYYYTGGSGCSASIELDIEAVFTGDSAGSSSISGSSLVCSGSTTSLYCYTTGGVWSSSSTGIATVGASTGIVTGVSAGVVTISYAVTDACGTGYATSLVTVNPILTSSPISGPTTVVVGATINLSDWSSYSVSSSWTSEEPAIAIVSSSGVVTGITPGTATIQYIVNGCTTSDTLYTTITVTALNGISGTVFFGSGGYWGSVKVWLITFNTVSLNLEAIDSLSLSCAGTSVYYSFPGLATDSFRVKAARDVSLDSVGTTGFIPTYHDSSYHWNTASVINYVSGTSDTGENIHMNIGIVTSGPGFISGSVLTGAGKHTSGGAPVVGLLIYVVNAATNIEYQQTYTDASGNYSFSNLPVGETYLIYPESMNYTTTVYSSITLTSASPSMTAADFLQHNGAKTITPIPAGVNNITPSLTTVGVFPNPCNGKINLYWNETASENGLVTVTDMTGRELYKTTVSMNVGSGSAHLDLSSFADGLYIISIKSANINYNTTINISK